MLTPLMPDFVGSNFAMFQPYVKTIANGSGGSAAAVLREIQSGKIQLWAIGVQKSEKERVALGVVATSFVLDHITGERNLLVNALHKANEEVELSDDIWLDGVLHLKMYALQQGCKKIVAFSDNPRVIEMFEKFGGSARVRFLQMEVV